jgi:hypothetical protein
LLEHHDLLRVAASWGDDGAASTGATTGGQVRNQIAAHRGAAPVRARIMRGKGVRAKI